MEVRGSLVIGGALALIVAGILVVDGSLIALGLALLILIVISGFLGWLNLKRLEVAIEGPEVIQAGQLCRFGVRLSNCRKLLASFGIQMELRGPGGFSDTVTVKFVASERNAYVGLRPVIRERGYAKVIQVRLSSSFPLGWFGFQRAVEVPHELTILPRIIVPQGVLAGIGAQRAGARNRPGGGDFMGDLRGIRDYRAGDRAQNIMWSSSLRSLAQGGPMRVVELDPPGLQPKRVSVLFHSYGAQGALIRPDHFERAISMAWGIVCHLHSRQIPVFWVADFEEWIPREISSNQDKGMLGEALARAKRSVDTESHQIEACLSESHGDVIVISDMPVNSWQRLADVSPRVRVLDYRGFKRSQVGKGAMHA